MQTNVANKLFISPYFNPIHPCILTTNCANGLTERCHTSKGGRSELLLCGCTESTYNTVVVDVGPVGIVSQARLSRESLALPARLLFILLERQQTYENRITQFYKYEQFSLAC